MHHRQSFNVVIPLHCWDLAKLTDLFIYFGQLVSTTRNAAQEGKGMELVDDSYVITTLGHASRIEGLLDRLDGPGII